MPPSAVPDKNWGFGIFGRSRSGKMVGFGSNSRQNGQFGIRLLAKPPIWYPRKRPRHFPTRHFSEASVPNRPNWPNRGYQTPLTRQKQTKNHSQGTKLPLLPPQIPNRRFRHVLQKKTDRIGRQTGAPAIGGSEQDSYRTASERLRDGDLPARGEAYNRPMR